jgi:hypothetical protein
MLSYTIMSNFRIQYLGQQGRDARKDGWEFIHSIAHKFFSSPTDITCMAKCNALIWFGRFFPEISAEESRCRLRDFNISYSGGNGSVVA